MKLSRLSRWPPWRLLLPATVARAGLALGRSRAIIPFGAGSAADLVPRIVFDQLSPQLGQPIVVENRTGAGGRSAPTRVAKADPGSFHAARHSGALSVSPAISEPARDRRVSRRLRRSATCRRCWSSRRSRASRPSRRWWRQRKPSPARSISRRSASKRRRISAPRSSSLPRARGPRVAVPRRRAEALTEVITGRVAFYFCPINTALPPPSARAKSWRW